MRAEWFLSEDRFIMKWWWVPAWGMVVASAAVLLSATVVVTHSVEGSPVTADAAVVLGAAAWGNQPSPVLRERVNYAVELYRSGRVRWLICTGGARRPDFPTEAEVACRYAERQGVPVSAVLLETRSRNTRDNLAFAKELADAHQIRTFAVVSDPFHMARAEFIAARLGMDVKAAPTPTSRFQHWRERLMFGGRETLLYLEQVISEGLSWFGVDVNLVGHESLARTGPDSGPGWWLPTWRA